MKFLKILIIIFLLPIISIEVQGQSKSAKEKIRTAKIKKSYSYKYQYKSGVIDTISTLVSSKQYDTLGNITEEISYAFETLDKKTIMVYDKSGKLTEKDYYNTYKNSPTINLTGKYTYAYNSNDSLNEWDSYSFDGKIINKCISKFDNKNHKTEETLFSTDGKINTKNLFFYDEKGNCIEFKQYPGDGLYASIDEKYDYTYNPKGKILTKRCMSTQKNSTTNEEFFSIQVYSYKYDFDGNVVEESIYYDIHPSLKGKGTKLSFKYDYYGNCTEENYVDNIEGTSYKETFKNDTNGNVIEEVFYNEVNEPEYVIKTTYFSK